MPVDQATTLSRAARKKYNIYVSYGEEKTLNETEMRQIMEDTNNRELYVSLMKKKLQ